MIETRNSSNSWLTMLEWVAAILVAVVIAVVIRTFLFAPYEVHGASMEPTLDGEELLIVNKWIYRVSTPEYGDIVVFHTDEERDFIKRVIGLPGDQIEIKDGKVYRNGTALNEPYINGPMNEGANYKPTTVPKDSLYVMGDNRNNSKDSRMIGPVSLSEIVGRADIVVLPVKRMRLLPGDAVATVETKTPTAVRETD